MAGNAIIGALRVVLGADSAALETGLKEAQNKLAQFGAAVTKAGVVAAAAFAAAGAAVAISIKGAIDEADKLSKAAQKIGVSSEELSKLKFAAELSDVSLEQLTKSAGKLSKNMAAIAAGEGGDAAKAFEALKIKVQNADGSLKSVSNIVEEVAGKFATFNDGAGKTALAMAIFGKSGADMIPLLNQGKDGLRESAEEAEKFGIVLSDKTGKAAEQFNDNLKRLTTVKDGLVLKITEALLPSLEKLTNQFVETAKDANAVKEISELIDKVFRFITEEAMRLGASIRAIGVEMSGLVEAAKLIAKGEFSKAWQAWNAAAKESETIMASVNQTISTMWTNPTAELNAYDQLLGHVNESLKAVANVKIAAPMLAGNKTAVDQFIDSTNKSIAAQQAEAQTVGKAAGEKEKLRVVLQGLQVATAAQIPHTDALKVKLNEVGTEAANAALRLQGLNLIQESLPIWTQYTQELENNRLAMERANATQEQMAVNAERVARKYGLAWSDQSASVAGSMAEIANTFGKENARIAKAAQVFGAVQALISTYAGSAEALKLPFPANLAASAAVLAKGLGLVAAIKSFATPGGFKTGGSFRVPGGVGGGDRMRAMVDLEPGEQVDIWRPEQGRGADPRRGAQESGVGVIRVVTDAFTRPALEKFIDAIKPMMKDGYSFETA